MAVAVAAVAAAAEVEISTMHMKVNSDVVVCCSSCSFLCGSFDRSFVRSFRGDEFLCVSRVISRCLSGFLSLRCS